MVQARNTKVRVKKNAERALNLLVISVVKVAWFSWYGSSRNCGTYLLEFAI